MLLAEPQFINLSRLAIPLRAIGTLGPASTSSEQAAQYLWSSLNGECDPVIRLFASYEDAGNALRADEVSHVVMANAYAAANTFYMDTTLGLLTAFILDTPPYGIARRRGHCDVPIGPTISTHPAPLPLINQLLPDRFTTPKVVLVASTSAAAMAVRDGRTDLALTTGTATATYNLEFISRTRTIRMLWSVFVRSRL